MNNFKITIISIVVFLFFSAGSLISCEKQNPEQMEEHEEAVKEVPQPVKKAFDKTYPGAEIKGYSKEIEDGQTHFEVACTFNGHRIDALYNPDGSVAEIEEVVSADSLPEAVKTSVANEFKDYSINHAEKVHKEGKVLYELKIKDSEGKNRLEVVFSEKGQILKKSEKSKEHEEDEESEENE